MQSARRNIATIATILAVILLITASSWNLATAQTSTQLQSGFSKALRVIQQAEAAGATPTELAPIIALLNQALALNQRALQMAAPQQSQTRQQLLTQVNEIISQVDNEVAQVQTVAAQRTQLNMIMAYVFGAIAALIGTIAYAYGLSFWRRYRIKRTFQMRVSAK
jgi:nitrate/nitrite-specific signal transduction histidine kinase